jgi:proteasome assembly chaperone (PAC2) family protein
MPASFNAAALPVPGLAMTRPGANSSIVAIDMAEMIGWREYGLMGAGATLMLLVDASSAMEVVSESRKQRWSDIQMDSIPLSSANCASSIISWIE